LYGLKTIRDFAAILKLQSINDIGNGNGTVILAYQDVPDSAFAESHYI
jgi:ribosomal protein RSM22 (predicted rRNA methylase)